VAGFGIKVTIVEPGGFTTDWSGSSAVHSEHNPAYDAVREERGSRLSRIGQPGDPAATAAAILNLVDADNPPLRLLLGVPATEIGSKIGLRRSALDLGRMGRGLESRTRQLTTTARSRPMLR
jgi:hypothetical protein